MGRMGTEPQLRKTTSGVPVVPFTLLCTRDIRQVENGRRGIDIVDCVAWRSLAEFVVKNVKKGQTVVVTGRLQTWSSGNEGADRHKGAEIVVRDIYFSGEKQGLKRGEWYTEEMA